MLFETTYNELLKSSKGLYKEKGSKFISYAHVVKSENQIKEIIRDLKTKEKNARHFCYGYILKPDKSIINFNDDGEPSNTAGKPILNQIKSKELTNCLIVVVRYFGGVKLGITGLIRAYKNAALDALQKNKIQSFDITEQYRLIFTYDEMNNVMRVIKKLNINIISQINKENTVIECKVSLKNSDKFLNEIKKNHKVKIEYSSTNNN